MEPSILTKLPSHGLATNNARWTKPGRTRMGQHPANKARGAQKRETREEDGDSEAFEVLCLCLP